MNEPPRHTDCTCGHRIVISREIQESPPGWPFNCPSCGKAWRAWQLIVNSNRQPPAGLKTGDRAKVVGGSYQALGWIVAAFKTRAGDPRYVFEFDTPPGMLHIFGPAQMEAAL